MARSINTNYTQRLGRMLMSLIFIVFKNEHSNNMNTV